MLWNNHCEKCDGTFLSGDEPPKECPLCNRIAEKEEGDGESANANSSSDPAA